MKRTGAGKGLVIESVPGSSTIGELLSQSPDFNTFFSKTGPKTSIVLNNKGLLYDVVKGMQIAEVKGVSLTPSTNGNKRINEISFYNSYLGGQQ